MKKSTHTPKYKRMLAALKDARQSAGLTQIDVAKRFGAQASFVSKCESGERRIDVLELSQFCRLYGIKVAKFLESVGID